MYCRQLALLLASAVVADGLRAGCLLHGPSARRAPTAQMAGFGATKTTAKRSFEGKKTFERQMRSYTKHRLDAYPPPNLVDVYVHGAGKPKFWFVGKSVAREGSTDDYALSVVVQKRLVLEHAKLLQPRELGGASKLELWVAPPNSEISVAQHKQGLRPLDGLKAGPELTMEDVGFLPEQYDKENQAGFFVRLDAEGQPMEDAAPVKIVSPEQAAAGGLDLRGS